jgi:hypothetical protein
VDKEFEAICSLRKINQEKYEKDLGNKRFCVCSSTFGKFMIRCELCLDWFHATCVPLPKMELDEEEEVTVTLDVSTHAQTAYKIAMKEICFICPCCTRSKKPIFNELLPLLRSLSKLPFKMVESEAFRCLTERFLRWEDHVSKILLENPEIKDLVSVWKSNPRTPASIYHTRLHKLINEDDTGEERMVRIETCREVRGTKKVHRAYEEKPKVEPKSASLEKTELLSKFINLSFLLY